MPHVNSNIVLKSALKPGDTLTFPYPEGKNEASFFGAFNHNFVENDVFYKSPVDFTVHPKAEHLELHWEGNKTLPEGGILYMRLEELGTLYYNDPKTNVTLNHTVPSNVFMVNLRAPKEKDRNFYVAREKIASSGELTLKTTTPDVPRNVTILSTAHDTARRFQVDGFDCYERPMTETIQGPNAGVRQGKKAFAKVTRITVDDVCSGDIAIGIGNRLGLPVFLPAPGYVIKALVNGVEPKQGMVISGEVGKPAATSGDRRGTYTPSPSVKLNGRNAIYLLMSLPNPGNIGSPDFVAK